MSIPRFLKFSAKKLLRRRGKVAFLQGLPHAAVVLDVGCGSNSPARVKDQRPDVHYVGLDVSDYNHTYPPQNYADCYILSSPQDFATEIEKLCGQCNAVISSHNLEHCLEPDRALRAMSKALRIGGRLYLTFPCEASVNFPSRAGTLNFYDDPTHQRVPDYQHVLDLLAANGMHVDFARRRHRPAVLFMVGLLLEPISRVSRTTMPGLSTWALYGFESVIWATRRSQASSD